MQAERSSIFTTKSCNDNECPCFEEIKDYNLYENSSGFDFQIHQPFRLKRYRFFDIGNDHYYYDDYNNDEIITRIAHRSYLPANQTILEMIKNSNGKFKVAFSSLGCGSRTT